MKTIAILIGATLAVVLPLAAAAFPSSDQAALLRSYLSLEIAQQAKPLSEAMAQGASSENQAELDRAVTQWTDARMADIRTALEKRFPGQSREFIRLYVARYTECEAKADASFLKQTSEAFGMEPTPKDYASFRDELLRTELKPDVEAASQFLSELQTWLDLKQRQSGKTPPLTTWLSRKNSPAAAAPAALDPLAAAEAPAGASAVVAMPADVNPLDSITAQEKNRREKKVQESLTQMQQVAAERKQYEDQAAAQKVAAAQAETEAMKHQAEQMAAVEQTAMQQRQNSWSAHLMKAAVSVVGAVGGAAGGAVGATAGLKAADQIFP